MSKRSDYYNANVRVYKVTFVIITLLLNVGAYWVSLNIYLSQEMLVLSHCKLNLKTLKIMNPRFLSRIIVHMGQGPDTV